jgi:seryl-tRNA synthetase
VIDLHQLRREPDVVTAALGRRGVATADVDEVVALDVEHRRLLSESEALRAEVKELSRGVADARRAGDDESATQLTQRSRLLGDQERAAHEATDLIARHLRDRLLLIPNVPSPEAPDGVDGNDNVELRRWWVGADEGRPEPTYGEHQRVPHWETGRDLGILDLEAGSRIAGSMFPLFRGDGSRLVRALSSLALDRHADAYEEIRPPSFALTETMTSTGHLPKSADDMYEIPRDDLWAIPTSEVPLTSMHRGEILDEDRLPVRLTALTPCFRREAGAAGRDTRGLLRVHEFDKVELFAYCTPDQHEAAFDDILARAEGLLRELGLTYQLLDLCCGDLGTSSARTIDLNVYSPGVDQWLEVSSVSWFRDYQARRANVRYRSADGTTALVHTVNGSALAWARIWAALVETYRTTEGTVELPEVLAPYLGGQATLTRRSW